jgi:hypothetical protein
MGRNSNAGRGNYASQFAPPGAAGAWKHRLSIFFHEGLAFICRIDLNQETPHEIRLPS